MEVFLEGQRNAVPLLPFTKTQPHASQIFESSDPHSTGWFVN